MIAANHEPARGIKPTPAGARQVEFRPGVRGGVFLNAAFIQKVATDKAAGQPAGTADLDKEGGEIAAGTVAAGEGVGR